MAPPCRGRLLALALSFVACWPVESSSGGVSLRGSADHGEARPWPQRRPVLVDTDGGIDDAFALLWICSRLDVLDLVVVTAASGNVGANVSLSNVARVLRLVDCGANTTFGVGALDDLYVSDGFMGKDGMGGHSAMLPDVPRAELEAMDAGQLIVDSVDRFGPELAIIAIGPLGNLAAAERIRPGVLSTVRDLLILGGSVAGGNVKPYAEFNFWYDAPAAHAVLSSVSNAVLFPEDVVEDLCFGANYTDQLLAAVPGLGSEFFSTIRMTDENAMLTIDVGSSCLYMYDPFTVGFLLHPSLFTTVRRSMDVVASGDRAGHLFLAPGELPNVWQAVSVDARLFDHLSAAAATRLACLPR